jgi:hypothetical protein
MLKGSLLVRKVVTSQSPWRKRALPLLLKFATEPA